MLVTIKRLIVAGVLTDPGSFGYLRIRGFKFYRGAVAFWEDGDYDSNIACIIDMIAKRDLLDSLVAVHLSEDRIASVLWAPEIPERAVNVYVGLWNEEFDARNFCQGQS